MNRSWTIINSGCAVGMLMCFAAATQSPAENYHTEMMYRKLCDKPPREIARYLAHPYPASVDGVVKALAEHGEATLPLLKELIKDKHPGLRRGALRTLRVLCADALEQSAASGGAQVPDVVRETLQQIRTVLDDPDPWVQMAIADAIGGVKLDIPEIHEILYDLASNPDPATRMKAMEYAKHWIETPEVKIKIGMLASRAPNNNPGSWLLAHVIMMRPYMDYTRPAVPVMLEFLDKHCMTLSGMVSNLPKEQAMYILDWHAAELDPDEVLPVILRNYMRIGGNKNKYILYAHAGPRSILMKMGPRAIPTVRRFLESERDLYRKYEAGDAEPFEGWEGRFTAFPGPVEPNIYPPPYDSSQYGYPAVNPDRWESVQAGYLTRFEELEDMIRLIEGMDGEMDLDKAATLCRIYAQHDWLLKNEPIRNRLAGMGAACAPAIRAAAAEWQQTLNGYEAEVKQGEERQADIKDKRERGTLGNEIKALTARNRALRERVGDLMELADILESTAHKQANAETVMRLCRYYREKEWAGPKERIREAFRKWGEPALRELEAYVKAEQPGVAARAAEIDEKILALEPRGYPTLAERYALEAEKWNLENDLQELADLAAGLGAGLRGKIAKEDLPAVCRCYTRRGWAPENELIAHALKKTGAAAVAPLQAFIASETEYLAKLDEDIALCEKNVILYQKPYSYWKRDRLRAFREPIPGGLAELKTLAGEL